MIPEISAPIRLDAVRSAPQSVNLEADADQRAAVAARLGVERVESLTFEGTLARLPGVEVFEARGRATMRAERICVVTLEPFLETTEAAFVERVTQDAALASVEDDAISPEDDEIELIEEDAFDFGEAALQYLAMELAPYPRSPEADEAAEDESASEGRRPFAGLDELLQNAAKKRDA